MATIPLSAMASGASRLTSRATTGSGCDAGSAIRAARPLQSCPIGWRLRGISACVAASRPVSASPQATPLSKQHRTAKIHRARPIHPLCADGRNVACSACAVGLRPARLPRTFFDRPPSLPGIWARSAVFCPSRQEVRESQSSRRLKTADSLDGLSACPGLAPGAVAQPRPMDGAVPSA